MRHALVTGTQMALGALGATATVGIGSIITLSSRRSITSSVDTKKIYYTDRDAIPMILDILAECGDLDYMLQTLVSDLSQGIWIGDHTQFEGLHEFSWSCKGTSLTIIIDLDDEVIKPIYRSNGRVISILDALKIHQLISSNVRILLRNIK